MSTVLLDSDVLEKMREKEVQIYLSLQGLCGTKLSEIKDELLKDLYNTYEIEGEGNLMESRRFYLQETVVRILSDIVRDCEERFANKERVRETLQYLKTLKLPEQRSPEWYAMRENVLTASSLADALGKGHFNTKESLLIDKTSKEKKPFFTNDIIQWGVKYEPIATAFYEHSHNLTIVEFGLVPHPTFPIFGASPDGICDTDAPEPMIGRMLEIKCPPKRNFTDEVPEHYWMQMQGQLETCDLEECDFLQVKLEEYPNSDAYREDVLLEEGSVKEGLTKRLVLIFNLLNFFIIFCILVLFLIKSKPPSVVISFLFSGTIQIKLGFILIAFLTIFEFVEISKFTSNPFIEHILLASASLICLLSSLK